MRLFLAVAVLMLAFIAYTEAQEETTEQTFAKFGEQMTEMGKDLAEKAKTTFENINNSEFAVTSRYIQFMEQSLMITRTAWIYLTHLFSSGTGLRSSLRS
uniref:Apolipoprotein C-I-like n=1 Tax=Sparus aurata TaxID=8175 RepID=A0A671WK28_SPAAU